MPKFLQKASDDSLVRTGRRPTTIYYLETATKTDAQKLETVVTNVTNIRQKGNEEIDPRYASSTKYLAFFSYANISDKRKEPSAKRSALSTYNSILTTLRLAVGTGCIALIADLCTTQTTKR